MIKYLYIFVLIVVNSAFANAASLEDVLKVALESDPILSSADYQRYATRGDKTEACGKLFPQLSVESSYVDYKQEESGTIIGENSVNSNGGIKGNQSSIGVTLNQPIIDLNKLSECRMWRASVNRDDANYEIAVEELVYRVVNSYLDVLASQTNLDSANSEVKLYKKLYKEKKLAYEKKVINQRELSSVNAKLNNALANKIKAENDFIMAKEVLQNLYDIDIPNEKLLVVKDGVVLTLVEEASPEHWADVAEQSNLNLIRSQLSEQVYKHGVSAEKSRFLPSLEAFASRMDYDSDLDRNGVTSTNNGHFSTEAVGVRLNWKLFSGGSNAGRVKAAKNRYMSAQKQLEADKEMVRLNAKNASRNLVSLKAKIDASMAMLEAARFEYDAVKNANRTRTKTEADLLEATLNFLDARLDVNQARYDYVIGVMDFWKSIGSLSVDSVSQIDSLFIEPRTDVIQMSEFDSNKGDKTPEELIEFMKELGTQINDWMNENNLNSVNLLNNLKG
jgi:outer membrane protein